VYLLIQQDRTRSKSSQSTLNVTHRLQSRPLAEVGLWPVWAKFYRLVRRSNSLVEAPHREQHLRHVAVKHVRPRGFLDTALVQGERPLGVPLLEGIVPLPQESARQNRLNPQPSTLNPKPCLRASFPRHKKPRVKIGMQ
jgi:hypothetical protein